MIALNLGAAPGTKAGALTFGTKARAAACRELPFLEDLADGWRVVPGLAESVWSALSDDTEPAALLSQGVSGGGGDKLGLPAGGVLGDASASML